MHLAASVVPALHISSVLVVLFPAINQLACTAMQEAFSVPGGKSAAGSSPAPLGDDSAAVALLCNLIAVFLQHGLVSSLPG
jgi:hypothetical protein